MNTSEKNYSAILQQIGTEAIYADSSSHRHVEILSIEFDKDGLHWRLKSISTPGFTRDRGRIFTIGGNFEYISFHGRYIGVSIVNWRLVTNQADVRHLVECAPTLKDKGELRTALNERLHRNLNP